MRLVLAQYRGYINHKFIFTVQKKNIAFLPHEITVLRLPLIDIIKSLEKEIDSLYKLAVFWDSYGYYVLKNSKEKYEIFDALTNISTGTTYQTLDAVPVEYMFKPVQKHQRKLLLAKVRQKC